jgi:hypothetical protein
LGALDGTPVKVTVPTSLKGRYRSRKAYIATNVLGVCDLICNSSMCYLVGRARHMMVMCFEMHFQGQMGCVSLKATSILETLKSFIGTLCSANIDFFCFPF